MLLSFKHPELLPLSVGTTATAGGFTGVLTDNYAPTYNAARACYNYSVQFKAPYWAKNNTLVKLNVNNTNYGPIFDLTDTPAKILAQIAASAGWTVGTCLPTEVVVMHFEGTHCVDALNQLCQACDPNGYYEWWFVGNTVHIGKLGKDAAITIELTEDNIAGISANRDAAPPITKLYAYGSDKNLNARYGKSFIHVANSGKVITDDFGNTLGMGYYDPLHILSCGMFRKSAIITEAFMSRTRTPIYPRPLSLANYSYRAPFTNASAGTQNPSARVAWQDTLASVRFTSSEITVNLSISKLRDETEIEKEETRNMQLVKEVMTRSTSYTEQVSSALSTTKTELIAFDNEFQVVKEKTSALEKRADTADDKIKKLEEKANTTDSVIAGLRSRIETLESQVRSQGSSISSLSTELGSFKTSTNAAFASVYSRLNALENVEWDISYLERAIDDLSRDVGKLESSLGTQFSGISDQFAQVWEAINALSEQGGAEPASVMAMSLDDDTETTPMAAPKARMMKSAAATRSETPQDEDAGISVASMERPDPGDEGEVPEGGPSGGGSGTGGGSSAGRFEPTIIIKPGELEYEKEYEKVVFGGVSLTAQVTLIGSNGTDTESIILASGDISTSVDRGDEWSESFSIALPTKVEFRAKKGYSYYIEVAMCNVNKPSEEDYDIEGSISEPSADLYFEEQNIIDAGGGSRFNPWGFPEDDERSRCFGAPETGIPSNIIAGRCPTSWFTAPSDYASYIVSGSPRLRLPEGAIGTGDVEGMIIFDDIYPSMSGTLGSDLAYDAFEEKDEENLPTGRWLKYYSFTTSLLPSTLSSDDLTGETMHIVFTSGRLNGMDFELKIMGNASGVCKLCIIPNEDYSALVPNDTLAPETGDTYKLYNVDACLYLEGDPIAEAEAKLRAAAQTYLSRQLGDTGIYNCTIKATKAGKILEKLGFGNGASLSFGGASLESTRVIGIKRFLDLPEAGLEIMVGNSTPYRKLDYIEKKVTVG